ncbi:MAG: accessory factor UbiK family protein [Rhodospirillales bacterium]|nr:accessory factor UbiK family protein [Rhodospirillales bacterium]
MQTRNRIFDDFARVANGAVSTIVGIKDEIEAIVRSQLEKILGEMDVVPRDEFEAVKAMAAKARSEQEWLEKRIAALEKNPLEKKLAAKPAKPAARKPRAKAAPKAAPKKA